MKCEKACKTNDECIFADLYFTIKKQFCYLRRNDCGDWQANKHSKYYLFEKGIITCLYREINLMLPIDLEDFK